MIHKNKKNSIRNSIF